MPKKGSKRGGGGRPKPQHSSNRDGIERKRDERSQRNKLKKERRLKEFHGDYTDDDFVNFRRQLEYQGFKLREIQGDGNCLFRALADQLNGDDKLHIRHRKEVVEYMRNHEDDFAPFLDETVTFEKYLQHLGSTGTYGGNDSIVAFARKNSVDVVIHQYNSPAFVINEDDRGCQVKLHLAYHTIEHYSSVRTKDDPGDGPAHLFHRSKLLQKTQSKVETSGAKCKEQNLEKVVDESKCNEETITEKLDSNIEKIKNATGFQDEEKIKEYFDENEEDYDTTLSFILQMMAISEAADEEKDDAVCQDDFKGNVIVEDLKPLNQEENNLLTDELANSIPGKETEDTEPIEIANPKVFSNDDDLGNKSLINNPDENDTAPKPDHNEGEDVVKLDLEGNEKCKCEENGKCKCKGNDDRKPKNIGKNNKQPLRGGKVTNHRKQHLSNRQRKELAKQERKKRREENKRETSSGTHVDSEDDDTIPTAPADIHVISI